MSRAIPRITYVFAYNCQIRRQKEGISQEVFSARAKVHRTAYQKFEAGQSSPSLETLEKIAKAFNVGIGDLLVDPGIPLNGQAVFRMARGRRVVTSKAKPAKGKARQSGHGMKSKAR